MQYTLVKSINNNVVLVKEGESGEQVILMAKGIGFGRKAGDTVSDELGNETVYKFWNDPKTTDTASTDRREIEAVVREIAQLAEERLGIKNNSLYPALLDHISFAVDRMHFALPIDNPFLSEISILYSEEYEVAREAVEMLNKRLGVAMGSDETGYIALHFSSARKNKPVQQSMQNVLVYNKILSSVFMGLGKEVKDSPTAVRAFLLTLDELIRIYSNGKKLTMPVKGEIFKKMPEDTRLAHVAASLIGKEFKVTPDEHFIAFLAVEIEKLRQID